ncbi:MAG: AI-2E family transporter [Steroidobacteraceae bacterium]
MSVPDARTDGERWYGRLFAVGAIGILSLLLLRIAEPFVGPLAWSIFLAFLLNPLQRRLTALLRGRDSWAALILTTVTFLLFVGPLSVVGALFVAQASELVGLLDTRMSSWQITSMDDVASLPALARVIDWVEAHFATSSDEIQRWVLSGARNVLSRASALGGAAFLGAVGTVVSFTAMLFLLFFFLRDGGRMAAACARFVPLTDERKHELVRKLGAVTRAVVFGTALTAAVQGTLLGAGFAIAGLPAPIVFGVIGAVLSVVPFGGTALVWVPGAAALFLQNDVGHGLFLAAWGLLVVSTVDNFIKPAFISGQAEVPTLAVFIGVIGGLSAFGLIGMFIGPIVLALALVLLRFADESLPREAAVTASGDSTGPAGGG